MSRQWLRKISLVVGSNAGSGLDLSPMRIKFSTKKGDLQTPNTADIRVYNLSPDTANRVQKEFTRVVLQAGYQENFGIIFKGNIKQVRRGRENGTDTYLDIFAADGDAAYNFSTVNQTLAAGSGQKDVVGVCAGAMQQHGVTQGAMPELAGPQLPRGQVMYGMARDYMRTSAQSTGTSWSIQDGQLTMIPRTGYLPGQAVVLTAKTGLIGTPEQTQEGIRAKALLNPQIRIGTRVKIDNNSILRAKIDMNYTAINMTPKVANDGFYRVLMAEYQGDTHGQDWYVNITCLALDDTVPAALAAKGAV